jgi:MraZ protein
LGERETYIGYGMQAIDLKGRVALPNALRSAMETNNGGRSLFIDVHEDDACLILFDRGWIARRRDQIARDENFERTQGRSFDLAMARRDPFVTAEPAAFDASGRFGMPQFLLDLTGLGKLAFFSGAIDYIEMWNPDRVLDSPRAPDRAKRYVEWHFAQKGGAK